MSLRQPLRQSPGPESRRATMMPFPAPIKGWNTIQPISNADPQSAYLAENVYIRTEGVAMRQGSLDWVTGFAKAVETLMPYRAFATGSKLFAATADGIFDATTSGAVGAAVSSATNGRWSYVNFANSTSNQYLYCFNGVDDGRYYDGSTWTTVANYSVGFETNKIKKVTVYKGRMYFLPKEKREFWYLPTGVITGTAAKFVVGQDLKLGGSLTNIDTWTVDAGAGMDDYLVVISSEGEMVVYTGVDPSSATDWKRVGVFNIPRPLGERATIKIGGDLLVLTEAGLFSVSDLMQSGTASRKNALSYNIETKISDDATAMGVSTFGWDMVFYQAENLLLVNIPTTRLNVQYVLSLQGSAWSSFTGWDANCWGVLGGTLYYGGDTKVVKAMTGTSDNGDAITALIQPSFNFFGKPEYIKQVKGLRATFLSEGDFNYMVAMNVDFALDIPAGYVSVAAPPISRWDTARWDMSYWSAALGVKREWLWVQSDPGYCAAPVFKISSTSVSPVLVSIDYLLDFGDGV